jgi:hypothetical protein
MTDSPCENIPDLVNTVEQALENQLRALIHTLQHQENRTEADLIKVLPQARQLILSKLLSRMLGLSCEKEIIGETSQALTILLGVAGQLLNATDSSSSSSGSVDRQVQAFQKKTAEFSKTIARKEKIIADKIAKSQRHIAGLQQKMTRK